MTEHRLGDYACLIRGITFKPSDVCDPHAKNAVACMRTKNVQTVLDESDLIGVPSNLVKSRRQLLCEGDILVSSANSWNLVGKCCYVKGLSYPATAGGFISILRPIRNDLSSQYLYHWFSSPNVQQTLRSFGNQTTNISNLNHSRTLDLKVPLPPLPEQKRIAEILDAADALQAKRRESLALLDDLLQSSFLHMFGDPVTNPMGWENVRLASIATTITKGASPNWQGFGYQNEGILFVTSENVREGFLDISRPKYVPLAFHQKLKGSQLKPGDLLVNLVGASIGRSCVFEKYSEPANINQAVGIVRIENRLLSQYIHQLLQTNQGQSLLTKRTVEAARANLSLANLRELLLPIPPVSLQTQLASIVQSVEKQKSLIRTHLAELDALFASLQSRAFNGDL
jgi:type I restriction enzyme S subunit